jgi:hypothetical protein
MLEQNHQQSEEGHKRLREDMRSLELKHGSLEASFYDLSLRLNSLASAPTDLSKVTMTPRFAIWLIGGALVMVGSIVGGTYTLKSDIGTMATKMDDRNRLDDERTRNMTAAIEAISKEQKLQALQSGELREALIRKGIIR